jgi:hypothetical protein
MEQLDSTECKFGTKISPADCEQCGPICVGINTILQSAQNQDSLISNISILVDLKRILMVHQDLGVALSFREFQ